MLEKVVEKKPYIQVRAAVTGHEADEGFNDRDEKLYFDSS